MVHAFKGKTGRHGSVADDGYGPAVCFTLVFGSHRHTQCGADRSRRMAYPESIIFALTPFGESAQAIIFTIAGKLIAATGKDLMTISLVTHVPYQLVIGRIKNVVQGNRQLDNTKAGRKMTAMHTHRIDDILTKLITYLMQLLPA